MWACMAQFWGEPDDGVKVRRAKGCILYEMGVKIWGCFGGWPEGSKLRETLKTALCNVINGVNGNEYHTVLGRTRRRG